MMEETVLTKAQWVESRIRTAELREAVPLLLRSLRQKQEITQLALAKACNTTPQTIQRLETAQTTLTVAWLQTMIAGLKMTPQEFFQELFRIREGRP